MHFHWFYSGMRDLCEHVTRQAQQLSNVPLNIYMYNVLLQWCAQYCHVVPYVVVFFKFPVGEVDISRMLVKISWFFYQGTCFHSNYLDYYCSTKTQTIENLWNDIAAILSSTMGDPSPKTLILLALYSWTPLSQTLIRVPNEK